jgi:hypothetical protein
MYDGCRRIIVSILKFKNKNVSPETNYFLMPFKLHVVLRGVRWKDDYEW